MSTRRVSEADLRRVLRDLGERMADLAVLAESPVEPAERVHFLAILRAHAQTIRDVETGLRTLWGTS